ncbi:MAG TPA: ABC transporter permease [Bryobacteraceae bacterium]|nr:ABC transporter permease [Bryobacteraceae bacterium]
METLGNDLRYAFRALARDRGFAIVAILTLALGIGANTAIFSIVNSVLLRPLAYREPGQLVTIREVVPSLSHIYPTLPVNALHFDAWRKQCASFESLAEIGSGTLDLTGAGEPVQLHAALVSATLFHVLGVEPRMGRSFLEEEDQPGHDQSVVLTDSLWRNRLGADPSIVGKKIRLDGLPHTVVGVLPAWFRFPRTETLGASGALDVPADIFKPIAINLKDTSPEGEFNYNVIARLKHGATEARALAELNVVQAGIAKKLPEKLELKAKLEPLEEVVVGPARQGLLVLLSAVGAVLLIVCVNLANLLLARSAGRARESAIRTALGASRARLLRQALTESLLLAIAGGALGVVLAYWGLELLVKGAPLDLPRLDEVHLDGRVLTFALLISTITGLLFGILPAWRLSGASPQDALKAGSHTTTEGTRGTRLRGLLVSLEVGLSAVLLIAAGLLTTSFVRLMQVDKGFTTESVLAVDVALPDSKYDKQEQREQFYQRAVAGVESLPGVRSAAVINQLPLQGEMWVDIVWLPGDNRPMFERPFANMRFISPGYFKTLGIPLRRGRTFEQTDRGKKMAIISQRAAERLWPGQDPVGRQFGHNENEMYQVAGVAADVRVSLHQDPVLMVYLPYWDRARSNASLVVRTAMDSRAIAAAVRAEIWKIDPEVPVPAMRTMDQVVSDSVGQRRFQMSLLASFAAGALLLASLGIYGVVSYSVSRRRNEIGIRIALGARGGDVYRMVLRQGLAPVALGLIAGVAVALAAGRILSSLLFQVSPTDPFTIGAVTILLAAVAVVACSVPAVRAMRVEPMKALRYE